MFKQISWLCLVGLSFTIQTSFADTVGTPLHGVDNRQGVPLTDLLSGKNQQEQTLQQEGGQIPLLTSLFNPTLATWFKAKSVGHLTPSGFLVEGDYPKVNFNVLKIDEVSDLSRFQYFYKESLHAELVGKRADEIIRYTHSNHGKVYVSTTIEKVYPQKEYTDDETKQVEHSQCVDILTRITVTKVPLVSPYGLANREIDFWQDLKSHQCHTDAKND